MFTLSSTFSMLCGYQLIVIHFMLLVAYASDHDSRLKPFNPVQQSFASTQVSQICLFVFSLIS